MNSKKGLWIVGITTLSLLFIGGLVYFNFSNKKKEESDSINDVDTSSMKTSGISSSDYINSEKEFITLNGTTIEAAESVKVDGTTATITTLGTYHVSGTLTDGEIIVDAGDNEVTLILAGVNITSLDSAPIYIQSAKKVTIVLEDETTNILSDSKNHTVNVDSEPDAVIFSKDDLIITGNGTLEIYANYADGVASKDGLVIENGEFKITAVDDGIRGKDYVEILSGSFEVTAGGDAIKSTNDTDTDLGYVFIKDGTFNINSVNDGIQAETKLTIENGTYKITTSGNTNSDSSKGLKAGTLIEIHDGTFDIDTTDDGIHSNANLIITNGRFGISSNDDAVHADGLLQLDGGSFELTAHEGLEATYVKINDGSISIYATDDGINAGNKSSAYSTTIEINGGTVTIEMGNGDTDAIDSNGNIYVNGGTIDITAQSAFDYDGEAKYNGGTIIVNGVTTNTITNQFMGGAGMQGTPGDMQKGMNGQIRRR